VFHVSLFEPYRESGRVKPPPPSIEMEGALEYEVEWILDHQFWGTRNPKAYYEVAWEGYGIEHNSCEGPESKRRECACISGGLLEAAGQKASRAWSACPCLVSSPSYTDVCLCSPQPP
jgi:hypothetical protein